ncbi:MAG: glycoside hydrolase family 13 protein [Bacteroides sp.]|nr:glycoside hydrolase family 13 protein [Bacteroides sp.]
MKKVVDREELGLKRIEPLSWWVGMKTPLQLMMYGTDLAGSRVKVLEEGVRVTKVHTAESPDYLFVDVAIDADATPGTYTFEVKKGKRVNRFSYKIGKRRRGSAARKSFSSADLIYMLMPDRFANGNPAIDNTPDTVERVRRKDPFGRHGGDLYGVMQHLDYITSLGATALWLTPPQLDNEKTYSYHGYACADYYRIDPRLGDNDLYRELVGKAHEHGLKVIMDAVPNHCGTAHWWMADRPFANWVHCKEGEVILSNYRLATITDPNGSKYDCLETVRGWFDECMPDLGMENPYLQRYFLQLYVWWIEWADLDGLRVDTYPYNDKEGIAWWTRSILEEYPQLNIVGECWHSSPAIVSYWQCMAPNVDGYSSHLPAVMDFPLQEALNNGLAVDTTDFYGGMNRIYEALALDFLYPDPKNLLVFLDNHDIDRFADEMKGHVDKIKLGLTMLATLRGIPQLYYGTEFGMRSDDLSKGHGAARKDFPGGWKGDHKDLFTGRRQSKEEKELLAYTRKLFQWRKTATAIHKGETTHFLPEYNSYAYIRYTRDQAVWVFINPSDRNVQIDWKRYAERLRGYTTGVSVLDDKEVKIGNKFVVKAHTSAVVEFTKKRRTKKNENG